MLEKLQMLLNLNTKIPPRISTRPHPTPTDPLGNPIQLRIRKLCVLHSNCQSNPIRSTGNDIKFRPQNIPKIVAIKIVSMPLLYTYLSDSILYVVYAAHVCQEGAGNWALKTE